MRRLGSSFFLLFVISLMLTACATSSKQAETDRLYSEKTVKPGSSADPVTAIEQENVDFVALQTALGLDRSASNLGFAERLFDTCQAGYGFSKSHNCRQRYYVVIHFQLMCRNSEGTVSEIVRAADLQANANRSIRWTLKDMSGTISTDSDGFSQIRVMTVKSQKQQRLKLAVASDFLYLRAGEVDKIVTPQSWCR